MESLCLEVGFGSLEVQTSWTSVTGAGFFFFFWTRRFDLSLHVFLPKGTGWQAYQRRESWEKQQVSVSASQNLLSRRDAFRPRVSSVWLYWNVLVSATLDEHDCFGWLGEPDSGSSSPLLNHRPQQRPNVKSQSWNLLIEEPWTLFFLLTQFQKVSHDNFYVQFYICAFWWKCMPITEKHTGKKKDHMFWPNGACANTS